MIFSGDVAGEPMVQWVKLGVLCVGGSTVAVESRQHPFFPFGGTGA